MGGLDKIIGHISRDAENEVKSVLDAAKNQAEGIIGDAKIKTAAESDSIIKKAETEVRSILERGRSSADLKTKQLILEGKQELISSTIRMAKDKLNSLDDQDYIDFISGGRFSAARRYISEPAKRISDSRRLKSNPPQNF